MKFNIIGEIKAVEIIAVGNSIRELERLREAYGPGRWRKLKGMANIEIANGVICQAEVHWYEAHGIGKREMKIKYLLD